MTDPMFGKRRQLTREESMNLPGPSSSLRDINLSLKKGVQRRPLQAKPPLQAPLSIDSLLDDLDPPPTLVQSSKPNLTPPSQPQPGPIPVKFFLNAGGTPTFFAFEHLKTIPLQGDWFCFAGNEYTARKVVQDMRHGGGAYYVILVKEPTTAPVERKE